MDMDITTTLLSSGVFSQTFWELFGKNLGLSFLGLVILGLAVYGTDLSKNRPGKFWVRHKHFAIWAILFQAVYSLVLALIPGLEPWIAKRVVATVEALLQMELNIPQEHVVTLVYLSGAWLLSLWAKRKGKKGGQNAT
ncbi:hypothetical protein [Flagellimonas eckloniae]|nr:hypothetical protein [Allomuricauda eckloniae]